MTAVGYGAVDKVSKAGDTMSGPLTISPGATQLNANPTFESGTTGWTAQNGGTLTQSSAHAHSGTEAGKLAGNGSTSTPQIQTLPLVAVTAGETVTFSPWLYVTGGPQNCFAAIHFYTSLGVHITSADVQLTQSVTSGWQQFSIVAFAPPTATQTAGFVGMTGTPATSVNLYADDAVLSGYPTMFNQQVTGDNFPRFSEDSNGRMAWGPGTGAPDTFLYRSGPGQLTFGGNPLIGLLPSGDTTGASDVAAIQALCNLGATVVNLGQGQFWINGPLVPPQGCSIIGVHGATPSGDDASAFLGTVIRIAAGYTNPTYSSFASAAILCFDSNTGTGSAAQQVGWRFRDFWIDGTDSPASVDGIAGYGPANAIGFERVGCFKLTGNAFPAYKDSGIASNNFPDGWHFTNCVAQQCTGDGWTGNYVDTTWVNCHAQSCGGDGFVLTGGNNRMVACRADLCTNGFTFDVTRAVGSDAWFDAAATMVGCGTQLNAQNGINVTNSSASGQATRAPVFISGCSLDGDGVNGGSGGGGYAGLAVAGANLVYADNLNVLVSTVGASGGSPEYGVATASIGTGPGTPGSVRIASGHINAVTAAFNDAAPSADFWVSPAVTVHTGGQTNNVITQPFQSNLSVNTLAATVTTNISAIKLISTHATPTNAPFLFTANSAGDLQFAGLVSGDTSNRWRIDSNGTYKLGPGSSTQDVQFGRTAANVLGLTSSHLDIATAGFGLQIAEGSNARQGTTTLNGTTAVVVGNTTITANTRIFLSIQDGSVPVGIPYVSARSATTSFSLKSTSNSDTAVVVAWLLTEPG